MIIHLSRVIEIRAFGIRKPNFLAWKHCDWARSTANQLTRDRIMQRRRERARECQYTVKKTRIRRVGISRMITGKIERISEP